MNSADYYNSYLSYKAEAESYENKKTYVNGIKNKVSSGTSEYLNAVNTELNALKENVGDTIRYDDIWTKNAALVINKKEKSYIIDSDLSSSVSSLNTEIDSLNTKKLRAEANRDEAYRNYEAKKAEEEYEAYLLELEKIKKQEEEKKKAEENVS